MPLVLIVSTALPCTIVEPHLQILKIVGVILPGGSITAMVPFAVIEPTGEITPTIFRIVKDFN